MRDNPGWFCIPVLAWHSMPLSERPRRPVWPGAAAYLGTFLLVPLWDVWALAYAIRRAHRAGRDAPRPLLALILSEPVRRLLVLAAAFGLAWAGLGLPGRLLAQPGPFGVLATGLRNLPRLAEGPCCAVSTVIQPGAPLGEMLAARLPVTLGVLAAAFIGAGAITALLLGVSLAARRWPAGLRLAGWLAAAALAAPAGAVALLVVLVPGVRLGLLPTADARAPLNVIAAGLVAALLPALLSARAGLREAGSPGGPWFAAARAFSEQSGWLVSSLIAVEAVFSLDGVGALLVEGLARGDAPAAIQAVQVLALLLLVLRLRAEINRAAALALAEGEHPVEPAGAMRPLPRARLALALIAILLPLAVAVMWLPYRQAAPDPAALYQRPSEAHPLGTDHLGRDVRGQVSAGVLSAWGTALAGAVVALGFGGLWGLAASAARRRSGYGTTLLADALLLPAEAAVLIHAPVVALLLQGAGPPAGGSALWLGAALGLILVPRTARATAQGAQRRHDWLAFTAPLALAVLAAMEYSQIVALLAPDGLLARHQELIVGAQLVPGGPYLRLGVTLALPGIATTLGAYLLTDAVARRGWNLRLLN